MSFLKHTSLAAMALGAILGATSVAAQSAAEALEQLAGQVLSTGPNC